MLLGAADTYVSLKGGVGPNAPGGDFVLIESVVLSAEVRDQFNQTVPNQVIGFYVRGPNQTDVAYLVRRQTRLESRA